MKTNLTKCAMLLGIAFSPCPLCAEPSGAPPFIWTHTVGSSSYDEGHGIAVDAQTNVYVTGDFYQTVAFGTNLLTAPELDMFLAKYDRSGNVLWARRGGSPDDAVGGKVAVDQSGNVYVTGWFLTSLFSGTNQLTETSGNYDICIAKYDSSGNLLWARQGGGPFDDSFSSIGVDGAANCYVAGSFFQEAEFSGTTVTNPPGYAMFLAKYDPAGNLVWIRQSGSGVSCSAEAIAVDTSGNSHVTGSFSGAGVTFGGILLTNTEPTRRDVFVVKYDTTGDVLWADSGGGVFSDYGGAITLDSDGNCIVAGSFALTGHFGPYTLVANPSDQWASTVFVTKYDSGGNLQWATQSQGYGLNTHAMALASDPLGDAYVVGRFQNGIGFEAAPVASQGGDDGFIARIDGAGDFKWSQLLGATDDNSVWSVATPGQDFLFVTGDYRGLLTIGGTTFTNAGRTDYFVSRLGPAAPCLEITRQVGQVTLSWPASDLGFDLESSTNHFNWESSASIPTLVSNRYMVVEPSIHPSQLYRLHLP